MLMVKKQLSTRRLAPGLLYGGAGRIPPCVFGLLKKCVSNAKKGSQQERGDRGTASGDGAWAVGRREQPVVRKGGAARTHRRRRGAVVFSSLAARASQADERNNSY